MFSVSSLVAVLLAIVPSAQQAVLRGTVTDATAARVPLDEVTVTLTRAAPATLSLSATTLKTGRFQFVNLEPGVYVLSASLSGFEPYQATVEVPAGTHQHDISLKLAALPEARILVTGDVRSVGGNTMSYSGKVIDLQTRAPIRDILVTVYPSGPKVVQPRRTRTNDTGAFAVDVPLDSDWELVNVIVQDHSIHQGQHLTYHRRNELPTLFALDAYEHVAAYEVVAALDELDEVARLGGDRTAIQQGLQALRALHPVEFGANSEAAMRAARLESVGLEELPLGADRNVFAILGAVVPNQAELNRADVAGRTNLLLDDAQVVTSAVDLDARLRGEAFADINAGSFAARVVTARSGTNMLRGEHSAQFTHHVLQASNLEHQDRLPCAVTDNPASGCRNGLRVAFDVNGHLGGPIKRDRAWFLGAADWSGFDPYQLGATQRDGAAGVTSNRLGSVGAKLTLQAAQSVRTTFGFTRGVRDQSGGREVPFSDELATTNLTSPSYRYTAGITSVVNSTTLLEARFEHVRGFGSSRYHRDVTPADIAVRDVVRGTQANAATEKWESRNRQYQASASVSHFASAMGPGSHDLKLSAEFAWQRARFSHVRNGDHYLELADGTPIGAQISNTPANAQHDLDRWAAVIQDRWRVGRATIQYGVRLEGEDTVLPAASSPKGTFVEARSFGEREIVSFPFNASISVGLDYDLFADGNSIVRGQYSRFHERVAAEIAHAVNPLSIQSIRVAWNDADGDRELDVSEFTLPQFKSFVPSVDAGLSKPVTDEYRIEFQRQLWRDAVGSIGYVRRQYRNGIGIVDQARPSAAYRAETRTYLDPDTGAPASVAVFNLGPSLESARDRRVANVGALRSTMNAVEVRFHKRLADRWRVLADVTLQRHRGFAHTGGFTNPGTTTDANDPTFRLNREDSSLPGDVPWRITVAGGYEIFSAIQLSARYTARAGDPLVRTFEATDLTQGPQTVWVRPRGTDRTDDLTRLLDVGLSRVFTFNTVRFEVEAEVFNVLNAGHVTGRTTAAGSTWGRVTHVTAPRILRIGAVVRF
jgi:hypothetical protein